MKMRACMHTHILINIYTQKDLECEICVIVYVAGLSDGSGEDDISPMGSSGGMRQFSDQRSLSDRPVQQDMDYSSANTLWSNSSR